jgi:hypothetical protein
MTMLATVPTGAVAPNSNDDDESPPAATFRHLGEGPGLEPHERRNVHGMPQSTHRRMTDATALS